MFGLNTGQGILTQRPLNITINWESGMRNERRSNVPKWTFYSVSYSQINYHLAYY